jgi:hypothetical protein
MDLGDRSETSGITERDPPQVEHQAAREVAVAARFSGAAVNEVAGAQVQLAIDPYPQHVPGDDELDSELFGPDHGVTVGVAGPDVAGRWQP